MNDTSLPQAASSGANPLMADIVDLAAYRAQREARRRDRALHSYDRLERCAELSRQEWEMLERAGYGPNTS
jgi:hypothetical protein